MLTDFYVNKYYTNKLYKFRRGNQKLGRPVSVFVLLVKILSKALRTTMT